MESGIFRKTSIERLASPERLNECVKLVQPRMWYVMAGILVIVSVAMVWLFTGTIPERVSLRCVAFDEGGETSFYAYVPFSVSKRLSGGMAVEVSPDYAPREEFGFVYGSVADIGHRVVDESHLERRFGALSFVRGILPPEAAGNFVEVRVEPQKEGGKMKRSNIKGADVTIENGAYCTGVIVVKERRLYEFIIR